jgi:hypothetical protein
LAFDESGERLTPTHAVKKGTRYRYYVSRSLITGAAKDHTQGRRIPAGNLESLVIGRVRAFLTDEGAVLGAITDAEQNGAEQKRLIARGCQISGELPTLAPDAIRAILVTLVSRVDIKAEHIEIRSPTPSRLAPSTVVRPASATPGDSQSAPRYLKTKGKGATPARRPRDAAGRAQRRLPSGSRSRFASDHCAGA